jgi:HTH-type transcriptional regulator/antitoxin HipB
MDDVGKKIKELRKRRGISQSDLAKNLRLSRSTISGIENGTIAEIGFRKMEALLNFFGHTLVAMPKKGRPTLDDLNETPFHD